MSFNRYTWTQDYTGAKGLSQLAAEDARRKGYTPKSKTKIKSQKSSKDN